MHAPTASWHKEHEGHQEHDEHKEEHYCFCVLFLRALCVLCGGCESRRRLVQHGATAARRPLGAPDIRAAHRERPGRNRERAHRRRWSSDAGTFDAEFRHRDPSWSRQRSYASRALVPARANPLRTQFWAVGECGHEGAEPLRGSGGPDDRRVGPRVDCRGAGGWHGPLWRHQQHTGDGAAPSRARGRCAGLSRADRIYRAGSRSTRP